MSTFPRAPFLDLARKGPGWYQCAAVVDGDTLAGCVLIGISSHLRIHGIDAPERGTDAGKAAAEYLYQLIGDGSTLRVECMGKDKYGRLLARVFAGEIDVAEKMLDAGHAVAWDGRGPKPKTAGVSLDDTDEYPPYA